MTKDEYYRGKPGAKYGVYNTIRKCWQFGICEDTPALAQARLFQKIGEDARKHRFQLRRLPPDGLTVKVAIVDEAALPQNIKDQMTRYEIRKGLGLRPLDNQ